MTAIYLWIKFCIDGIPQDEEYTYISSPLFITYTIIATFGIIFATTCLICNLWLRNQKYVVMLLTIQ